MRLNKYIKDELKEKDIASFRGGSERNMIYSDLKSRVSVTNIPCLMFINISEPPAVAIWNSRWFNTDLKMTKDLKKLHK